MSYLIKLIFRFAEDLTNLPLTAIEAVLSSDELQVESEDAVFDFVIKWARKHYTNVEERREMLSNAILLNLQLDLSSRLAFLIMTTRLNSTVML
jgi:hypothetical protein